MSTVEVAELTGKRHDNVLRYAEAGRVRRVASARGDALRRQIDLAQENAGAQKREFGFEVALGDISPPATTQPVRAVGPAVAARLQQILAIEGRIDGEDADSRFAGADKKRR